MNNQYKILMGQFKILITSEFPLTFSTKHETFLQDFEGTADIRYFIQNCKTKTDWSKKRCCYTGTTYKIYHTEQGDLRIFDLLNQKLILGQYDRNMTQFFIDIESEKTDKLEKVEIIYYLALEIPFLYYHAFWLHASLVTWKRRGIVFTAPSGTGKSTQAELWKQFMGAKIINGDRVLLRNHGGRWRGHGSIYAGSSHIYSNDSTKVDMLILLEQGTENRLIRLKSAEAFWEVYKGVLTNPWSAPFTNAIMDEIMDLLVSVPVYRFSCRPDQDAVCVVKEELERLSCQ